MSSAARPPLLTLVCHLPCRLVRPHFRLVLSPAEQSDDEPKKVVAPAAPVVLPRKSRFADEDVEKAASDVRSSFRLAISGHGADD